MLQYLDPATHDDSTTTVKRPQTGTTAGNAAPKTHQSLGPFQMRVNATSPVLDVSDVPATIRWLERLGRFRGNTWDDGRGRTTSMPLTRSALLPMSKRFAQRATPAGESARRWSDIPIVTDCDSATGSNDDACRRFSPDVANTARTREHHDATQPQTIVARDRRPGASPAPIAPKSKSNPHL